MDHPGASERPAVNRLAFALEWFLENRRPFIVLSHLGLVVLSSVAAIWLRFDGAIPAENYDPWLRALPWLVIIRGLTFAWFGLYQGLWRYASIWDLKNIVYAVVTSSLLHFGLVHWVLGWALYPRSVSIIDAIVLVLMMGGVRLTRRFMNEFGRATVGRRILVYGAGDAGEILVRDMRNKSLRNYHPIGFIDDDRNKVGIRIHGIPVLGTRDDLPGIMSKYKPDEILLAIPRADPQLFRRVVRTLDPFNVPIKTVPTLREILENKVEIGQIRNLSVQDLLSRRPVGLDAAPLRAFLKGRRVMVTGAGGSIGSELCRQVAAFEAEALILVDRSETGLFHITNELADLELQTAVHSVIGDVTDRARMEQVLRDHRPQVLFHAAAHKHVPLMEQNICEAVKNNVMGTRIIAECAERAGVDRFVLISTDKAVNPSSIMGVTKRVAELLMQGRESRTTFVTVRFGNVLASSGSVVPRFLQQIGAGGPVTVTHPEMRRFFMLIVEAVQLVLLSAARGDAGGLYVLEMGEPVKLIDLARDMIRMAGFAPEVEIPITFIGLRPGEKLSEELIGDDERAGPSLLAEVMSVHPLKLPDRDTLAAATAHLEALAREGNTAGVLQQLGEVVPAFHDHPRDAGPSIGPAAQIAARVAGARVRSGRKKIVENGQKCPACSSNDIHRSQTRSRVENIRKAVSFRRPYRCHACTWRGWLVPMDYAMPDDPVVAGLDSGLTPNLGAINEAVASRRVAPKSGFGARHPDGHAVDDKHDQAS